MSTKKNKVLVLRTCNPDMTSHGQFKWPESGQVKAPDWDATPKCGHGLHGLLWGEGSGGLLNWDKDAKWLVVEVDEEKIVKIDEDKVKFPCGKVVYCGDRKSATDLIIAKHNNPSKCVGCIVTVGDNDSATAGYRGTATAGDFGTATAGEKGILNIKYWDDKNNRFRIATAYVGEDGIEPNVAYRLDCSKAKPKFVKVNE